jgi:hypothetical protein
MIKLGAAALACYSAHALFHLINGRPEDLLWACHLGSALVGVGLLLVSASGRRDVSSEGLPAAGVVLTGIGTLFLLLGTPLWLMDLAGGGVFYPTSALTHIGGLAIGLYGVRRLGMPRGAWWKAVGALIVLILICRLVAPPHANVNVAFAIYASAANVFTSHLVYLATMLSIAAAYFLAAEYSLRRWLSPAGAQGARASGVTGKDQHERVDRRAKSAP